MKNLVFDTSILLSYLQEEKGYKKIETLFAKEQKKQIKIFISEIILLEISYLIQREHGVEMASMVIANLEKMPFEIVSIDRIVILGAAALKAKGGISVADSLIAALAMLKKATLLTLDPEFERVKKELKIEYL